MEQIKKTLDSNSGRALKTFLISKLDELRDIENIGDKDTAINQSLELKSQKRAYKKLKEILSEIMTFSGDGKKRDPRDSFSITDEDIN
jgi:hypothetical protein